MATIDELKPDTIDGVIKLVRMNHDASKGFEEAAEKAGHAGCIALFREARSERERFATELKAALHLTDADIPEGRTAIFGFHRAWMNVRCALTSNDTAATIAGCERGESHLFDAYTAVLEATAGGPFDAELRGQASAVKATLRRLEELQRDLTESPPSEEG